jgi:hypothetical protein
MLNQVVQYCHSLVVPFRLTVRNTDAQYILEFLNEAKSRIHEHTILFKVFGHNLESSHT